MIHERLVCTSCIVNIPATNFHRIRDNPVEQLFWGKVYLRYATAFFYFNQGSLYRSLIHQIKYHGRGELGIFMGKLFGNALQNTVFARTELIVPVPMHRDKLKKRKYNQSEIIAEGMSRVLKIKTAAGALCRIRDDGSQTGRSRLERRENTAGNFRVADREVMSGKHVLLVDDVVTTGATLEACAEEIAGIPGVTASVAALAYAEL